MASEALEHILSDVRGFDQSIDVYAAGTIALYTPRPEPTYNGVGMDLRPGPICDRRYEDEGSFEPEPMDDSPGQYTMRYGPLVERIDFSGHNDTEPHVNYNLLDVSSKNERKLFRDDYKDFHRHDL